MVSKFFDLMKFDFDPLRTHGPPRAQWSRSIEEGVGWALLTYMANYAWDETFFYTRTHPKLNFNPLSFILEKKDHFAQRSENLKKLVKMKKDFLLKKCKDF